MKSLFTYSLTIKQWCLVVLVLLVVCGQRLISLCSSSSEVSSTAHFAAQTEWKSMDSTVLARLDPFRPPTSFGPGSFRVGVIDISSPRLRDAPPSSLNAKLRGTLSGRQGIAVVEYAGQQGSYSIGDTLAGEAEVVRIFYDRIIINRRGQYESMVLN
jgi:type II secretory pathway component PulC